MTDRVSENDVVTTVIRLTRRQLVSYIEAELVKPQRGAAGLEFGQVDIARLELLCDLSQDLDLDETALSVVISLLDQLHTARRDLATLATAINTLPADLREGIAAGIMRQ